MLPGWSRLVLPPSMQLHQDVSSLLFFDSTRAVRLDLIGPEVVVTFDDGRMTGDGATDLQMEQQGDENLVELAMVRACSSRCDEK